MTVIHKGKKRKMLMVVILTSLFFGGSFANNLQIPSGLITEGNSLQNLCAIIDQKNTMQDGDMIFDPRESLFLKGFCWSKKGVDLGELKAPLGGSYYSSAKLAQYVFVGKEKKDVCKEDFNSACDFLTFGEKLYTAIMSDLFRYKWSYVGLGPGKDEKERAVWQLNAIRVPGLWKSYEDWSKLYPKSLAMLKKNNRTFEKMQKKISLIDLNLLTGMWENALGGDLNGVSENTGFVNVVFNEYFWYNTFLLYEKYLYITSDFSPQQINYYTLKIDKMREDSRKTLEVALQELNGFSRTYPLHVARVIYQESLLDLRNNYLSKLVTPLYTLYDKFRNVQPVE